MKPDRVVFNALITACGQSGAVDRAFDVLAEMGAETQPIDPDHITVGALIRACANAGQVRLSFYHNSCLVIFIVIGIYVSLHVSIVIHLVHLIVG